MIPNHEMDVLVDVMRVEKFGPEVLGELALEIVEDGGIDTMSMRPQDILDALEDRPGVPWWDVSFAIGELFAGYVVTDFMDRKPNKREAFKLLMCVTVFGIACRHGYASRFDHCFGSVLELMVRTEGVIWDERLRLLAYAIENWKRGEQQERAQRDKT